MNILRFTKLCGAGLILAYQIFTQKPEVQIPVTHVIFDMDGTLIDTENIYKGIFKETMKVEFGVEYDDANHREFSGLKNIERCRRIVEKFKLNVTPEELDCLTKEMNKDLFLNTKLKPGAERLVTHLHASNVPIAVATGSPKEMYDIKTKSHSKLFGLFHHVVNAGSDPEVPCAKPDPQVYLVCLKRFEKQPHPKECLAFEDSYNGLLAARDAGVPTVLIPEVDYSEEQMKDAIMVIKSLEDFKPEDFCLPPYPEG